MLTTRTAAAAAVARRHLQLGSETGGSSAAIPAASAAEAGRVSQGSAPKGSEGSTIPAKRPNKDHAQTEQANEAHRQESVGLQQSLNEKLVFNGRRHKSSKATRPGNNS